MDLNTVKNYLRVDFNDDDEYIELLISVAEEYLKNAVGSYDDTKALCKIVMLTLIGSLYENRQFVVKDDEKVSYAVKSMITQLSLLKDGE